MTVIVIAHRHSTIKRASQVLYFKDGQLSEAANYIDEMREAEKLNIATDYTDPIN
jgi:ABC-type bacteriocin/lantibiotic exporter with double-glycine peptidase domain